MVKVPDAKEDGQVIAALPHHLQAVRNRVRHQALLAVFAISGDQPDPAAAHHRLADAHLVIPHAVMRDDPAVRQPDRGGLPVVMAVQQIPVLQVAMHVEVAAERLGAQIAKLGAMLGFDGRNDGKLCLSHE